MVPRIDLIALDLDGTLLNSSDRISSASRSAIASVLDEGIRVVIVTGRGADAAVDFARELGLNLPIICAHGALTKDIVTGKIVGHIPIPLQYAVPMIEFAEQNQLDAAVYVEEKFHRMSGMPPYMNDMTGPHWVEVERLAHVLSSAPTFLRFFGRDAVQAIRETFTDFPLHFKYETWGDFEELAVTSQEATKKNALERLCADLQISPAHVMAVGDSRNDVPMLRWAALGVAMGNALPEVRSAVKHVTASNDDDGVAHAIEALVLGPLAEEKKSA